MPHTVPNRPTKGALDATVARKVWPNSSRLLSSSIARFSARVSISSAAPVWLGLGVSRSQPFLQPPCCSIAVDPWCTRWEKGSVAPVSRMRSATASRFFASQKASIKVSLLRRIRNTRMPLVSTRYQVPIEAISISPMTPRAMPSVWVRKWAKPRDCSISASQVENDGDQHPRADRFGAALGGDKLPARDRVLRGLVKSRRAGACTDLDLARAAAGFDEHAQHHPAFLPHAPG